MSVNTDVEDLQDDGFEGSHDERRIFAELFFGNDEGGESKKCLVSGSIDFEYEQNKNIDYLLRSNSEYSVVTSHSSPNNLLVEKSNIVDKDARRPFASGSSLEEFLLGDRDDQKLNGKPMKFPSLQRQELVTGMCGPFTDLKCQPIPFSLVESSCQGITSSYYFVKQHDAGGDVHNQDVIKSIPPSLYGNDGKQLTVAKAVASPVSQESIANKILVASPKVGCPPYPEERPKEFQLLALDSSGVSLKTDCGKDPRPLLQNHIMHLLMSAGWSAERRKRPSRKYMDTIYRSPTGRVYREFPKAWRFCGQLLSGDGNSLVREDNGKKWTDISQFFSDLSDTLMNIEKENNQSDLAAVLAHRWTLLDPFVTQVYIEKNIGSLRKGETVKSALPQEHNDSSRAMFSENSLQQSLDNRPNSTGDIQGHSLEFTGDDMRKGETVKSTLPQEHNGSSRAMFSENSLQQSPDNSPNSTGDIQGHSHEFTGDDMRKGETVKSTLPQEHNGSSRAMFSENSLQQSPDNSPNSTGDIQGHSHEFTGDDMRKSSRRKSRKISEMKISIMDHSNSVVSVPSNAGSQDIDGTRPELKEEEDFLNTCAKAWENHRRSSNLGFSQLDIKGKGSNSKKFHHEGDDYKTGQKKPSRCQIKDDDLLVSAIIKKKDFRLSVSKSTSRMASKSRARRKIKSRKATCRLRTQNLATGTHSTLRSRTILSWLINGGFISLNEVIQYRNPEDDSVIKDGRVTCDGIICNCCSKAFTVSDFKSHAGFTQSHPCLNLFMESGKPLPLCLLQAWSEEYKTRKNGLQILQDEENDQNDDSCGICGDGGELICCDNCPSAFHQACLLTQDLPEGSWYCANCICQICGNLVMGAEASYNDALKCSQCERKYHEACLKRQRTYGQAVSNPGFCGGNCLEVYSGLRSRIGIVNHINDSFSWTLLRCIHEDQKVHSMHHFALKAECNTKLAVALTIMEECFQSMVDPRTGINMIPHLLYNWGSEFARLNFSGFYTVVLERDDVLVAVASIRVHGTTLAEMPLIATCSDHRRQGMCRRLMTAIEELLISLKVEKLVISAIPDLVETWTEGFGFKPVNAEEKQSLSKINLMVFPGAISLKKTLYKNERGTTLGGCQSRENIVVGGGVENLSAEKHLPIEGEKQKCKVNEK
ncbi:hypothetical protein HS088_TW19G00307 [Tripterygium wilfordii]|uniref:Acyl-CoA N-acyltransferase with RING/FYVE/PHD-type zinc finger protein n=1 Tax=Tripterygium wilfordii TaxID=458696 RepID=A0A7J7C9C1_TRIWF|nr:increased DNA methylation 1-like [Tripterygium wilfordii]XP_038686012.1 increased DNA methylation 1-like [Tripterygium wilfordii]KAF5730712.1 hypothetical protein HS088_TW19G00307 [Tripterygium wilfordii]